MIAAFASLLALTMPAQAQPPVLAFVLAGQSNMQGHGAISSDNNSGEGSLEHLVSHPATAGKFWGLQSEEGDWSERGDVWIDYMGRSGKLRPGYGVREGLIGPELGFGHVVGDAVESPVLIIKICWGGKSLGADFRPPSAGGETGPFYRDLIALAREALANPDIPELSGRDVVLSGFGWHQGWNDRVNEAFVAEYESNLRFLIRDLRRDLDAPDLPFVIAETGMGGWGETNRRALALMFAQQAVPASEEFRNSARFVGTRGFWKDESESPSSQGYHWNSNAYTYWAIGESMGHAMLDLLSAQ